ncbi:MAG: protein kinase [Chthoniobacteraceae bacterium]
MSAAPPTECFECGVTLSPTDTSGLCVKCILRMGLVSQFSASSFPKLASGLTPGSVVREAFDFGGYRILSLLGRGGMGAVYEAEQIASGRRVALKVLGSTLDTPELRARFVLEGQFAAAVRHPNVVAVFAAEEIEGVAAIAMEIVPSGTLKDRVSREGPLTPGMAVDAALQIIDGLEAAHAQGVLHRDIKPANCFLGPEGTVKVGDFGLSISVATMAQNIKDEAGQVVGTPAFASPEQLRGEEIDQRSDIYSVGATLYYLLTAKNPHEADDIDTLIRAVLEMAIVEPAKVSPRIPRDLSRVVMRSLSRKAEARFESYAALRTALLPFRSTAPIPAPPGLRFVAGFIDLLVMISPSLAFHSAKGSEGGMLAERTGSAIAIYLAFVTWEILCVGIPEGLWGAGLGKATCGLRVTRRGGGVAGIPRAVARGFLLAVAMHLSDAVAWCCRGAAEYQNATMKARTMPEEMLGVILFVILFVSMRRTNGYAALHDLLSSTRVIAAPTTTARPPIPDSRTGEAETGGERIGPFSVRNRGQDWVSAFDEALRRPVWIRIVPPETPAIRSTRRDINRPGRLRWLTGRRSPGESWDAYEAPDGAPLLAFLAGEQPWVRVRSWLLDLAEELQTSIADKTIPDAIGIDRLWVTREGRVVLVDFPAPGAQPKQPQHPHDANGAQQLLLDVASSALPRRLPLHAHQILVALRAYSSTSLGLVVERLRADIDRPGEVTLQRRLPGVLIAPFVALGIMLTISLGNSKNARRFDALWMKEHPTLPSLRLLLEVHRETSVTNPATAEQCSVVLAGSYHAIITGADFWNHPGAQAWQKTARNALTTTGQPGEAELRTAQAWIEPWLQSRRDRESSFGIWLLAGTAAALNFLLLSALIGLGGSALTGVPPGLRMNDIVLVTADGEPASRLRALWRGLLGWAPLLLGSFMLALCQIVPGMAHAFPVVAIVFGLVMTWLLSLTIRNPSRGPNDAIAGTWLVSR